MHKILQGLAVATVILSLITGIVAGNVYAPEPLYGDKEFLWSLALSWWASGVVSAIILFAFAEVIELLHKMVSNQQKLIESFTVATTENKGSVQPPKKVNLGTSRSSLSNLSGYQMNSND